MLRTEEAISGITIVQIRIRIKTIHPMVDMRLIVEISPSPGWRFAFWNNRWYRFSKPDMGTFSTKARISPLIIGRKIPKRLLKKTITLDKFIKHAYKTTPNVIKSIGCFILWFMEIVHILSNCSLYYYRYNKKNQPSGFFFIFNCSSLTKKYLIV